MPQGTSINTHSLSVKSQDDRRRYAPPQRASEKLRILIIDPALKSSVGHHITAARRLYVAAGAVGFETHFLCSMRARRYVYQEFSAAPIFSTDIYRRKVYNHRSFEKGVARTLRDLMKWNSPFCLDADIIILPTCDQVLAKALGRYLSMAPAGKRPAVMAWFLLPPDFLSSRAAPSEEFTQAAEHETRQAVSCLRSAVGGNEALRFFCETIPMADRYRALINCSVSVAPSPNMADVAMEVRKSRRPNGRLRVRMLGKPAIGKGYEILPRAIQQALDAGLDAEFFVHAAGARKQPSFSRVLRFLEGLGEKVTVCDRDLGDQEYYRFLSESDILLLPYDSTIYQNRGSGIFGEAESLGIPTIVVKGCEFAAEAIEGGRSIAASDFSGQALAQAIVQAAQRFDNISNQAYSRALTLRQRNPFSPEKAIQQLACDRLADFRCASGCITARPSSLTGVRQKFLLDMLHYKARVTWFFRSMTNSRVWQRRLENIGVRTDMIGRVVSERKFHNGARIPDLYGDSSWDVDIGEPPRTKYVLAAMHRSGSNLLVRQLFRSDVGLPAEYFHPTLSEVIFKRWGFCSPDDSGYIDRLLLSRCSPDSIWGCKVHWEHIEGLNKNRVDRILEGARVIFTRRRDLAEQTLSLAHARHSGKWDPRWGPDDQRDELLEVYDIESLRVIAMKLVAEEWAWKNVADTHQLPLMTVWYEDLLQKPKKVYNEIFRFLDVDRPTPKREPKPFGKTGQSVRNRLFLMRLRPALEDINLKRP